MEKKLITICVILGFSLMVTATSSAQPTYEIFLDADTEATGSLLDTEPLVTPYGTITYEGTIRDRDSDPDFNAAGASGDVFNIDRFGGYDAKLVFDPAAGWGYIRKVELIYGGNTGNITIEARDKDGAVVDSFYQADTGLGEPAGPITLGGDTGYQIRTIYWKETGGGYFAPLDNITLTIPAPGAILLGSIGVGLVGWLRRRRTL